MHIKIYTLDENINKLKKNNELCKYANRRLIIKHTFL